MSKPDIHADTQIHDDVIVFKINQTTVNGKSSFVLPDFIHPHEVEQKVNEFNDVSKDLVVDYHYTRVDKNTLTVQILLKPLFTKLGETQKYAHFCISRESDDVFYCERIPTKPLDINIPTGVESIPVRSIRATKLDVDATPCIQVNVTLLAQASTYKNVNVIVGFVKKLTQTLYEHVSSESG